MVNGKKDGDWIMFAAIALVNAWLLAVAILSIIIDKFINNHRLQQTIWMNK